jgi:dihydrofolate synthase/folylpolyglutamate synthase
MDYEQAMTYLESFVNYERTPQPEAMRAVKLDRMRSLCQRLGDPQRRFRSVLVAGTDGKGSICAMLYTMLRASQLRAGLYTSPHLENIRERIRVTATPSASSDQHEDGSDWITEVEFAALVEELAPIIDEVSRRSPAGPLTYFEIMTALAFVYFSRRHVDVAVVEVGLGGRLDATNVLEPSVAVIAPIDVDHTDVLGEDPVLIAREKAGIIKSKQTVISSPQQPGVLEVLRVVCEAQKVPLLVCGEDMMVNIQRQAPEGLELSMVGLRGIYQSLTLPLLGRHQAANAAVAVAAMESLSKMGIPWSFVEQGLAEVEWPGRLEIVHDAPVVILDGGHNALAARTLRATIEELWPQRIVQLLIGMSSDKSVEAIGQILGPISASVTCTKSQHLRALDPVALAKRLGPCCRDVHVMSNPVDAYTYLLNSVGRADLIIVTGSLFLVGELRSALRQAHLTPSRAAMAVS